MWVERFAEHFIDVLHVIFTHLIRFVEILPGQCESFLQSALLLFVNCLDTLFSSFYLSFSDFQIKLLQVFFCILTIHIIAICIAWKIYSERITQRFLKPSHFQISNEQLKTAVSELKLPAEHTPRW